MSESISETAGRELEEELGLTSRHVKPRKVSRWVDEVLGLRYHLFTAYTTKQPELRDGQAGSMWVSLDKMTQLQWQRRVPSFERVISELRRARLSNPEAVRAFSPPPSVTLAAQPQE